MIIGIATIEALNWGLRKTIGELSKLILKQDLYFEAYNKENKMQDLCRVTKMTLMLAYDML